MTAAGTIPADRPIIAARAVAAASAAGTSARACSAARAAANAPADGARPRPVSRSRSRCRPRARRLWTVPSASPIAAPPGQRSGPPGSRARPPRGTSPATGPAPRAARRPVRRGRPRGRSGLEGRDARLDPATTGGLRPGRGRDTTGHLMEPRAQRVPHPEPAGLPDQDQERGLEGVLGGVVVAEHDRQTPSTIGPCRSTRAAKAISAASPSRAANRSSNWPSVNSPIVPTSKSVWRCRTASPRRGRSVRSSVGRLVPGHQ